MSKGKEGDMKPSDHVEMWPLARLKAHPENAAIFDPPKTGETFATVLQSIRENGIWEPLLVKPDGTILAGHLRRACAEALGLKDVPVRVWEVSSYREEITLLIRSNTDRRHLSKREIGLAYDRLKRIPQKDGGAKAKMGRPSAGEKSAQLCRLSVTREQAATMLGVGRREAEACATVFTTLGVPDAVKDAVNTGVLAPTTTADRIRAEVKKQGGELKSAAPLVAMVNPAEWDTRSDHEKRIAAEAERFEDDCDRLLKAYQVLDRTLKGRPLASVLGPSDHDDYRGLVQMFVDRGYLS